jgi:hypothetical protein
MQITVRERHTGGEVRSCGWIGLSGAVLTDWEIGA